MRPVVSLMMSVCVLGAVALLSSVASAQPNEPCSIEQVELYIRGGVSPGRAWNSRISKTGLAFEVNSATEIQLRQAGATDEWLAMLRGAKVNSLVTPARDRGPRGLDRAQTAPVAVSNVQFSVMEKEGTILVKYDLAGSSGPAETFTVSVAVSTDGGVTFPMAPRLVTGDIGIGVHVGAGKQIIWKAREDVARLQSDAVVFRVNAEVSIGRLSADARAAWVSADAIIDAAAESTAYVRAGEVLRANLAAIDAFERASGSGDTTRDLRRRTNLKLLEVTRACDAENLVHRSRREPNIPCPAQN